ncbi:hypothetical protein ACFQ07_21590, partial [Actinomadura adrarensis]
VQPTMRRPVPDGPDLVIDLNPGIAAGAADLLPEQTLDQVCFTEPPGEKLDPVIASELLADLSGLR